MNGAIDRLIVALDVPTVDLARSLVKDIGDGANFYKVGLELVLRGGFGFVEELIRAQKRVFLDMKFLDISNTVERATANAAELGVLFTTIHGHDLKTMRAAVKGRGETKLKILAVTVLTHLTREDLADHLLDLEPSELVLHRAKLAFQAGCDGVICSPLEAQSIRQATGKDFLIVTPGIRFEGGESNDQSRIATPASAIRLGADYLVVGRPITQADNPRNAARLCVEQIKGATKGS